MRDHILNLILFFSLFSVQAYSSSISDILASSNNHSTSTKTSTIVSQCAKGALCPPENISVAEAKR